MIGTFLNELRRRRVFRTAAVYGAVAWLLIQIASDTFPALQLPEWSVRLVVMMCLLGFPLALILSWSFDLTASGITRTEAQEPASVTAVPYWQGWSFWLALGGGVLIGVATLQGWRAITEVPPDSVSTSAEPLGPGAVSLAVLPLENLSADPENAFFAAGLHDEILAQLAQVRALDVRSRTSVLGFEGEARPAIPEIARRLNVANVVEGSVQVVGNRVRIRIQLIEGASDRHLWADTYERSMDDVFLLQSDVAAAITAALQVSLSVATVDSSDGPPTRSMEAYRAYLEGVALVSRRYRQGDFSTEAAANAFQRAIDLDPDFMKAHAELSRVLTWEGLERDSPSWRRAYMHARRALELAPESADARVAMATYHYNRREYITARELLLLAHATRPNDAYVVELLGRIARRSGDLDESIDYFTRAFRLAPTLDYNARNLATTYQMLRRYDDAERVVEAALSSMPNHPSFELLYAQLHFESSGDVSRLEHLVASTGGSWLGQAATYLLAGSLEDQERAAALYASLAIDADSWLIARILLADTLVNLGRDEDAERAYQEAFSHINGPLRRGTDGEYYTKVFRVLCLAGLRRFDDARAVLAMLESEYPVEDDPLTGSDTMFARARVQVVEGDSDGALQTLARLMARPNAFGGRYIWADPVFRRLRDNPRFQAIVEADLARIEANRSAGR